MCSELTESWHNSRIQWWYHDSSFLESTWTGKATPEPGREYPIAGERTKDYVRRLKALGTVESETGTTRSSDSCTTLGQIWPLCDHEYTAFNECMELGEIFNVAATCRHLLSVQVQTLKAHAKIAAAAAARAALAGLFAAYKVNEIATRRTVLIMLYGLQLCPDVNLSEASARTAAQAAQKAALAATRSVLQLEPRVDLRWVPSTAGGCVNFVLRPRWHKDRRWDTKLAAFVCRTQIWQHLHPRQDPMGFFGL